MPDENGDAPLKLLLEEYKHLSDSLRENETMGERRLQFLFTLVTAAFGGIAALMQLGHAAPPVAVALLSAFVLLFLFGLVTLERIVKRNVSTDQYIDALNKIRGYFIAAEGTARYREAFVLFSEEEKTRKNYGPFSLRPGGLIQGTAVVNSVVAGAAFGFSASLAHLAPTCVFAGAALLAGLAWFMQWLLVRQRYAKEDA